MIQSNQDDPAMPEPDVGEDFADLPPAMRAEIEGMTGVGLHDASTGDGDAIGGEAFHHPERDRAGTEWEPDWEPMETYPEGEVVMLDDGERQILGRRDVGMWMQPSDGGELAQPDFQPMLWLRAPERVRRDMA